jgi:hypothetical protein
MKKNSKRRGSALLIAVVVVVLVAGLSGAFLTLTVRNSDLHFKQNQGDDAQQICDAGIEMARAALLKWRNLDDNEVIPPEVAKNPACYSWNKIFLHCQTVDGPTPTGMGTSANPDVIKADAVARFKSKVWAITADNSYNYVSTNLAATIGDPGPNDSTLIGSGITELFGVNRRYGKGAFHLILKNNQPDTHGDGIDNASPPSGNPWQFDPVRRRRRPGDPRGHGDASGRHDAPGRAPDRIPLHAGRNPPSHPDRRRSQHVRGLQCPRHAGKRLRQRKHHRKRR